MKIARNEDVLTVSGIDQLAMSNEDFFQRAISSALPPALKHVDIDLSETRFLDCRGVAVLIGLRNRVQRQYDGVTFRLLNPGLAIRRIFELTQLDAVFQIA
jgi:Anti-anti-sigma regulatory factor (antagonist of anti-sigma factor)